MGKLGFKRRSVFARSFGRLRIGLCLALAGAVCGQAQNAPFAGAPAKTPHVLGTIKSIAGEWLTVTTDAGTETKVAVTPATKLLRVPPGSKDLSQAEAIPFSEFQQGDRVLVRLRCAGDPPVCEAGTVIAMKKSDIAEKRSHEREEWQKHGIGGLGEGGGAGHGPLPNGAKNAPGKEDGTVDVGQNTINR